MFITECLAGGTGTEAANRLRVAEVWLLQPSPRLDRTQQPICSSRLPCTHLFYMRQGMSKVGNDWSTRLLANLSYLVSPQQMWDQSLLFIYLFFFSHCFCATMIEGVDTERAGWMPGTFLRQNWQNLVTSWMSRRRGMARAGKALGMTVGFVMWPGWEVMLLMEIAMEMRYECALKKRRLWQTTFSRSITSLGKKEHRGVGGCGLGEGMACERLRMFVG